MSETVEQSELSKFNQFGFKCECELAGFCERHQTLKTNRQVQICKGTSGLKPQSVRSWMIKWGEETLPEARANNPAAEKVRIKSSSIVIQSFQRGVGRCLEDRIEGLAKVKTGKGCGCKKLARDMDKWGPEKCDEEQREFIVAHLVDNAPMLAEAIRTAGRFGSSILSRIVESEIARPMLIKGAHILLTQAIEEAREERKIAIDAKRGKVVQPKPPLLFTEKPTANLVSHMYLRGDWRYHVERISQIEESFERIVVGVVTGKATEPKEYFKKCLSKHAKDLTKYELHYFPNDKNLREVVSYPTLLACVATTDRNHVTFCHHSKGSQPHTLGEESPVRWWTDAMYTTLMENQEEVFKRLEEGYTAIGSFQRVGTFLGPRFKHHYSGTFFALRNARAFINGVPKFRKRWFGTESYCGDHWPVEYTDCIFGKHVGNLYDVENQPRLELEDWKLKHQTRLEKGEFKLSYE